MPFLFPEGTTGLFRVIVRYRDSDNQNYMSDQFYYQLSSGVAAAGDIQLEFTNNFLTPFAGIVSDQVDDVLVATVNLGSTTDVYDASYEIAGTAGGQILSPWQCTTFRLSTGNRLAPYGWKRFSYVTENMNAGKGALDGDFLAEVVAMRDFLISPLNDGSFNADPVLVSPSNETHDDNLVLPFTEGIFQKIGHAIGRKSY